MPERVTELLNSYLWANRDAWQEKLVAPPCSIDVPGGSIVLDARLSSVNDLECVDGGVAGRNVTATLAVDALAVELSAGWRRYVVQVAIGCRRPTLEVTVEVAFGDGLPSVQVRSYEIRQCGAFTRIGAITLPAPALSAVMAILETMVDNPPIEGWIVDRINRLIRSRGE